MHFLDLKGQAQRDCKAEMSSAPATLAWAQTSQEGTFRQPQHQFLPMPSEGC